MSRLSLAAALVILAGCGDGDAAAPPEILYGVDVCDHCRMVISEERHAAGARLGGRDHRFDDPGCLLQLLREGQGEAGEAWVHDESASWLPVADAWFVDDPERRTPMASGILAFGSRAAAAAAAEGYGTEPRRWEDVVGGRSRPRE